MKTGVCLLTICSFLSLFFTCVFFLFKLSQWAWYVRDLVSDIAKHIKSFRNTELLSLFFLSSLRWLSHLLWRSDHCQAYRNLRFAPACGSLPQPCGAGSCSHLCCWVYDWIPSPGHSSSCWCTQDCGLSGHLHWRRHFQWIAGGLWQTPR